MRDFVLLRRYRRKWTPKTGHVSCIFFYAPGKKGLTIDPRTAEITNLLKAWGSGDEAALARLTDHAAHRVGMSTAFHALENHFGNRLLAVLAFAAGLVIEGLSHTSDLGFLGLNLVVVRRKRRKEKYDAALCHTS